MMNSLTAKYIDIILRSLGQDLAVPGLIGGEGVLPSAFPVTELATAAWSVAGLACGELLRRRYHWAPRIQVDQRLASLWFGWTLSPSGWTLPSAWDELAGDYATVDGWIRLHTNAPKHRLAVERVLGKAPDKAALAARVALWRKSELAAAVTEANGCAAEMLSLTQWQSHPHGRTLASSPLIEALPQQEGPPVNWALPWARPLTGVRVLDLTRVIAGPVATRFLAGLGATVLRIDSPDWNEPGVEHEVILGKRCARLDLRIKADREAFERLLRQADVIVHGYRAGALEKLGYGPEQRRKLSPGLIDVCLNAYGWHGPWRERRGFDSLVQMSCGIAEPADEDPAPELTFWGPARRLRPPLTLNGAPLQWALPATTLGTSPARWQGVD